MVERERWSTSNLKQRFLAAATSTIALAGRAMPTSYQVKLPPPTDWQELQRMTCDLYKCVWENDDIQQFGSQGQRQDGVDVFGLMKGTTDIGGVQCKCATALTADQVKKEYDQSLNFRPQLSKYVIVTTSKRDANVQKQCAEISKNSEYLCVVVFWDDCCQMLSEYPDVMRKYFSDFILYDLAGDSPGKLVKIGIDATYFEIVVSKILPQDEHYGGTILISDLQTRKCITYRIGDHWSRLDRVVGITTCDAFLVSKWLNSFANVESLLKLGKTRMSYDLTDEDKAEAMDAGFNLINC